MSRAKTERDTQKKKSSRTHLSLKCQAMIENFVDFGSMSVSLQVRAFIGTERESFSWVWQSWRRKTFLGAASDFRFRCTFREFFFRFRVSTELGRDVRLTDTDARFYGLAQKHCQTNSACLLAHLRVIVLLCTHARSLQRTLDECYSLSLSLSLSHTRSSATTHTLT